MSLISLTRYAWRQVSWLVNHRYLKQESKVALCLRRKSRSIAWDTFPLPVGHFQVECETRRRLCRIALWKRSLILWLAKCFTQKWSKIPTQNSPIVQFATLSLRGRPVQDGCQSALWDSPTLHFDNYLDQVSRATQSGAESDPTLTLY